MERLGYLIHGTFKVCRRDMRYSLQQIVIDLGFANYSEEQF
jgi:hypothetical protein